MRDLEKAIAHLLDRQNYGNQMRQVRLANQARQLYALRRRRDAMMPDMFGEPAWDMLLDLFVSTADGRQMPITNMCIASCAPLSTALRWIDKLIDSGFVAKRPDALDGRRSLIDLTESGTCMVEALLQSACDAQRG